MNYARRQQYRRLFRAGRLSVASAAAAIFGLFVLAVHAAIVGGLLMGLGLVLGLRRTRRRFRERERERWGFRHALRWPGRGDIDSVVIAPTGVAFAIETKTRTYEDRHVISVREQAAWLARRRRRWCRRGALGVLCVVRARGVERFDHEVLVVSIDLLVPALCAVAAYGRPVRYMSSS